MDEGKIVACIDGSCQPMNPGGIATSGLVVLVNGNCVHHDSIFIIEGAGASNNVGEYGALVAVLKWLASKGMTRNVTIRADSKLVIDQMTGRKAARSGLYMKWHDEAKRLVAGFPGIRFEWIPREKNAAADALTRKAYEDYCKARGKKAIYTDDKKKDPSGTIKGSCKTCPWFKASGPHLGCFPNGKYRKWVSRDFADSNDCDSRPDPS